MKLAMQLGACIENLDIEDCYEIARDNALKGLHPWAAAGATAHVCLR